MSNQPGNEVNVQAWIRLGVAAVAVLLLIVFVVQNGQAVNIDFIIGSVETRLIWALLLSAGLGFLIGLLLPRQRR